MTTEELANLMNSDEVRSMVIKDVAHFDGVAGFLIATYFFPGREKVEFKLPEFKKLMVDTLPISKKIAIIKVLDLSNKSEVKNLIVLLEKLRRLRNVLAHESHIGKYHYILRDKYYLDLFAHFPVSYQCLTLSIENAILSLQGEVFGSNPEAK